MHLKAVKLYLLILFGYLRRNTGWVVLVFAAVAILLILQAKLNLFTQDNVVRIGIVGTFQEHDLPFEVTSLLSTGLLKADSNGRISPNLVTGWDVNNDATEFKFKLKDNLYWCDGTQIKSEDLLFNIPNTEVSSPNEREVLFKLKQSYSPLPSLLLKPIFKKGALIGTGPYKISKIEKSRIFITKIILKSSDPKLPTLHFRFYPSGKVAVTGFNLGEVQVLMGLSDMKAVPQNARTKLRQKTDYSKIVTVLFNTADSILNNRSLRQAFAYQTPKIKNEETTNNPYPPDFWARDENAKKYLSNEEEAYEALERAKSSLSGEQLTGEVFLTTTPNLEETGRQIVSAWSQLGFDAKLRVESGIPQNFQALLITQSIPQDPDQYFLWHATQTKTNLSKYDSKRADKDLEDGRKAVSEDERKEKYFDFQKTLLEDAPAIFLYFPKYNIFYLKKVEPLLDKILSLQSAK
ncbi:MAG: ABC transporter substrate-binding protein [Patescibacteria group bacterium]